MSNKNGTQAAEVTLTDVMSAVQGVGSQVVIIREKVDGLEKRVVKLEGTGPVLKTRIVNSYAKDKTQPVKPAAKVAPRPAARHDDEGEDEAIAGGKWEKVIRTKPCNKIGITKTSKRDSWKLLLFMPGMRRPATFIGWDGVGEMIDFFAEVLPELSMDHFDEEAWREMDDGKDRKTPILSWLDDFDPFLVDWFKTQPNGNGHTFINIEACYPMDAGSGE
jgi:hypothetical protein